MTPDQVLRAQADLLAALGTPAHAIYLGAWLANHEGLPLAPGDELREGLNWSQTIGGIIAQADSYLIDADAVPLIRQSANDLPGEITVTEHTAPSRFGFAMFAEPYELSDVHGIARLIRAMSWSVVTHAEARRANANVAAAFVAGDLDATAEGGVVIHFWTSFGDVGDWYAEQEKERVPDLRRLLGDLSIYHQTAIPLDVPLSSWLSTIDPEQVGRPMENVVDPIKAAVSLFLLMRQPVIDTGEVPMTAKRRAGWVKRSKIPARISVVRLRRRAVEGAPTPESGQSPAAWSCRWIVKGHWHRYRTGAGRANTEWRYVHPFVKGPQDAPLRDRAKRVYRVTGEPTGGAA